MSKTEKIFAYIDEVIFPSIVIYLFWRGNGFESMVFAGIVIILVKIHTSKPQVHINGKQLKESKINVSNGDSEL